MTTAITTKKLEEKVQNIKSTDFRNVKLEVGASIRINGKKEIITEIYHKGKRLVRFKAIRRDKGGIAELGYSVDEKTGKEHQDYAGICYGKDTEVKTSQGAFIFRASKKYFELDEILNGFAK